LGRVCVKHHPVPSQISPYPACDLRGSQVYNIWNDFPLAIVFVYDTISMSLVIEDNKRSIERTVKG